MKVSKLIRANTSLSAENMHILGRYKSFLQLIGKIVEGPFTPLARAGKAQ